MEDIHRGVSMKGIQRCLSVKRGVHKCNSLFLGFSDINRLENKGLNLLLVLFLFRQLSDSH